MSVNPVKEIQMARARTGADIENKKVYKGVNLNQNQIERLNECEQRLKQELGISLSRSQVIDVLIHRFFQTT
jgi:hypothetical protein